MEPARQKIYARVLLAAFAAVGLGWLLRLDYAQAISTDVLDLLPRAEQSPEAALVRSLAGDTHARVMLFALRNSGTTGPVTAARQFAAELNRAGPFAEAVALADAGGFDQVGRALFERRHTLLLPGWLSSQHRIFAATNQAESAFAPWLAEHAAARLEVFLTKPEAVPLQEIIPADPLLLMADFAATAHDLAVPGADPGGGNALVWARIRASPLSEAGQQPVFAAIEAALRVVRATTPGIELKWTGVNRFAAASRARIESEVRVLNLTSIAAVLGVGCLFVRRPWKILHLVPVILFSLLGAWTVSTLVFARIHILVFVIGSLLSGVAIDYGFYLYMQPALRTGEPFADKLRRLIRPLLASCLTTVLGFSLLLFSDLPLLRQVGLFVAAGLLCALAAAILYFAQLERPFLESREFARPRALPRPLTRLFLFIALLIAVAGPWRLRWRDDVRDLQISTPELNANDQVLRSLFGDKAGRTIFLTQGTTVADARQHLENFIAYEKKTLPGVSIASAGLVFPTERDWREWPARGPSLDDFAEEFRGALARHGFTVESFAPFFSDWENTRRSAGAVDYTALYREFGRQLTGPLATLYSAEGSLSWFIAIVERGDVPTPPAALKTVGVNQLESLNGLFARYRWSGLRLSLTGLALVIGSVFAIYRGRRAVRIALIPAGACFFVFGMFGLTGQTLNLFHLLGAFLGVCLSHNYAIFSSETATAGAAPPVSIRISALSAASSFGVLGFSRIPVISALGVTVALIVLTALAVVEFASPPRATEP